MNFLDKIISGGVGTLVKDVVGTFKLSPEAKQEFEKAMAENEHEIRMKEMQLQEAAQTQLTAEINAKKEIMVAELNQGDAFTKRARPMIVYAGLLFIFLNYVFFPYLSHFTGKIVPDIKLPSDFWWVWGGVCGVWMIGRTMEKRGAASKLTGFITGNKN